MSVFVDDSSLCVLYSTRVQFIMSLSRFRELQKEHGTLDSVSKAEDEDSVRRNFMTFFLVTLVMQVVMLVFAVIYYFAVDSGAPQPFGTCVENTTLIWSWYPKLSILTTASVDSVNYMCFFQVDDPWNYVLGSVIAALVLGAGFACHLRLPTIHGSLRYIDVLIVVLVYWSNLWGPCFTVFTDIGSKYTLLSFHGGRVRASLIASVTCLEIEPHPPHCVVGLVSNSCVRFSVSVLRGYDWSGHGWVHRWKEPRRSVRVRSAAGSFRSTCSLSS